MKIIPIIIISIWYLFNNAYGMGEEDFQKYVKHYPVKGIDISHYQGKVDWKQLSTQGINFVYLKATEGGNFKDPTFIRNWNEAKEVKINRGAYHFFTFCKKGSQQAKNFIETVPLDPDALPPAIDIEFLGNCRARPAKKNLIKEMFDCIHIIEKRFNKRPILYLTYESYEKYLKVDFQNYQIWIRDYNSKPEFPSGRKWLLWQYTNKGRLKGIKGPLDMNIYNGTWSEFARFIKGDI